jgi:hypothetical protein
MEASSTLPGRQQVIESLIIYCVTCVIEGKNKARKKERKREREKERERERKIESER